MFGDDAETFLALVDFQSANLEEIVKKASVSSIEYAIRIAAQANTDKGADIPLYYYNFDAEIPGWDIPGTLHSVDLWFFFETFAKCWRPYVGKHYDLTRQMCNYWVNFIRSEIRTDRILQERSCRGGSSIRPKRRTFNIVNMRHPYRSM